jgi:signal transduction histidine kinase
MTATPVRQVFLNLIGNGVKFSNAGGTVTARMRLRQFDHTNKLRMEGSIQDEGVGMTPVEVGRLFQRFA